jgi:3-oxoacyl-[acyl-carrier protein] reductase
MTAPSPETETRHLSAEDSLATVEPSSDAREEGAPLARNSSSSGRAAGRRVLVIGGSGEIGSAVARILAKEGADVAVHYFQHRAEAEEVGADVRRLGRKTVVVRAGLASAKSVVDMRDQLHGSFGYIDTLVNCVGINRDCVFSKMNDDEWEEVIRVNLIGTYNCTKTFVEEIVASGHGRIINISSLVGQMGKVGQVSYSASRSGMIGFTKSLARELACLGTTVNMVAPGYIETPAVNRIPEEIRQAALSQIPMNRFVTPREVAMGVVYLVSDAADYVTGSALNMNGGMYL